MKKLLIFLSVVIVATLAIGWRSGGWRMAGVFPEDFTFEKNVTIEGTITSTSVTRGQASFTRNVIVDTVPGVTGVSTNSFILLTAKKSTALTGGLTWTYLAAESILVHVLAADTTGAALTYCWFRVE